uniref:Uncharacterized protein n=1 Tax=Anguilla anguilla TaxID=7936 RepID=A0A0E9XLU6_ANGAN
MYFPGQKGGASAAGSQRRLPYWLTELSVSVCPFPPTLPLFRAAI